MVARQMVVPHGYTLSVGGTLASLLERHPQPGLLTIWLFVGGAAAGVVLIDALSTVRVEATLSLTVTGPLVNPAAVAVVPLVALAIWWIPAPVVAFPLAGLACSVMYIAAVSLLFRRAHGATR
jgi:hypothetical protein